MKTNRLLALMASVVVSASIFVAADEPFRNHRFDSLNALEISDDNIVFVGNSITNMNEWWEIFGSNHKILNRGISGAITAEWVKNIDYVVAGHPKMIFIMLGTNDIGSVDNPKETIVANMTTILDKISTGSPTTRIYLQSILPSDFGRRNREIISATNDSLRQLCDGYDTATYLDLWDTMDGMTSGAPWTYDNLHPTAYGIREWTKKIAPIIGSESVYGDELELLNAGAANSNGARTTSFGFLPVDCNDILIFGDELVHGGEWHELFDSDRVKNRGTGWGYPGVDINFMIKQVEPMLTANGNKAAPAKIFVYAGAAEATYGMAPAKAAERMRRLTSELHRCAPTSKIYLMGVIPSLDRQKNANHLEPYNDLLRREAQAADYIEYIDTYTPLLIDGVGSAEYVMPGDYCSGKGYRRLAETMRPFVNE